MATVKVSLPTSEPLVRALKCGDVVEISGAMVTGRDAVHKHLAEHHDEDVKDLLANNFIYHCGPVVKQNRDESWSVSAAGPTSSIRQEPYEAEVLKRYGLRGAIGKGGMGKKTLDACREHGAVYLHAIGGLAALLAQKVVAVRDVRFLDEFGAPEAMWVLEVKDFPALVTMDAHGASLHDEVRADSEIRYKKLLGL